MKLICDNSNCSTAVKSFKIKLKRKIFAKGERNSIYVDNDMETLKTSKYIFQFKDTNVKCGPKQKVAHTLSFEIPKLEPDFLKDSFVT